MNSNVEVVDEVLVTKCEVCICNASERVLLIEEWTNNYQDIGGDE